MLLEWIKQKSYINGQWLDAADRSVFSVHNPFNQELIGNVPNLGAVETLQAVDAAHVAFEDWSKQTASYRSNLLRKWYDLQITHADELAHLLTLEQGKPLKEAKGEILYGASFVEWFAEEAKRTYGDVIPSPSADKRIITLKQPIGIVAAITPWNFPNAMITRKVAPALAAGCTVVLKPSEETPLSALALAALAEQAGIPAGVFNVITTNQASLVGRVLSSHPLVKKLSFTGSTAVGKLLLQQCASTVKKVSLELGGNAPFIVFDDADIDLAVEGAIASKYRNAGQTCVCANRIFVQAKVHDAFVERLSDAMKQQKLGNGLEEGVTIGPLINEKAMQKVERLMADALDKGARVLIGGKRHEQFNNFYEPTVLTHATPKMSISEEEIFGPVAAIYTFQTEQEVTALANTTPYGLAAYFYSRDISRVWRVAEALEYGIIGINTGLISTPVAPFGGMKESGIGREGSKYGIEEYLEIKYLCLGI